MFAGAKKSQFGLGQAVAILAVGLVAVSILGLGGAKIFRGALAGENECGDTLPIIYAGTSGGTLESPYSVLPAIKEFAGQVVWAKQMACDAYGGPGEGMLYTKMECYDKAAWTVASMRSDVAADLDRYFDEYLATADPDTGKGGAMPESLQGGHENDLNARCAENYIKLFQTDGIYSWRYVLDGSGNRITKYFGSPSPNVFAVNEILGEAFKAGDPIEVGDTLEPNTLLQKEGSSPIEVDFQGYVFDTAAAPGSPGPINYAYIVQESSDSAVEQKIAVPEDVLEADPEIAEWWEENVLTEVTDLGTKVDAKAIEDRLYWGNEANLIYLGLGAAGATVIAVVAATVGFKPRGRRRR